MQVIVLLAGQGKRMGDLTLDNHKSLLPINGQDTFLSYLLHQISEYPISKLILVTGYRSDLIESEVAKHQLNTVIRYNDRYKEDTNIYSLRLAMEEVDMNEPIILIEGDVYMENLAVKDVFEASLKNESIWYVKGKFESPQYGGILQSDNNSNILDIRIVKEYNSRYSDYYKLLGIMTIGTNEILAFKNLLIEYSNISIDQYYLIPWIENLKALPCKKVDLSSYFIESVNSSEDYKQFVKELECSLGEEKKVELVEVAKLLPIEGYVDEHLEALYDVISKSDNWIKPIIIDKSNFLVLDGHHRFEIAKRMELKYIPAILVEYKTIKIWSLRKEELVTHDVVIDKALRRDIYPCKTVKHNFNFKLTECSFPIKDLK